MINFVWKTLLMMIRGNSIQYSSGKKKRTQEEEVTCRLENEIKTIEQDVMLKILIIFLMIIYSYWIKRRND